MKLSHFFLPHPQTHKKAHLISWQAVSIYILLFLGLRFGLVMFGDSHPGVLGISSKVDQQELIEKTNQERAKKGLSILAENEKLSQAALEKAKNMFEEDYWAHYSPSGKDPWGFINGAGYKFVYAGENLARNFYTSQEVVDAWMNSPSHRDNLLSARYREIGMAVVQGVLKGQMTTLVVQEFGTPVEGLADAPLPQAADILGQPQPKQADSLTNVLPVAEPKVSIAGAGFGPIDPFQAVKAFGFLILICMSVLILVDLYIMQKRMVFRLSSRHIPHLSLLGAAASALYGLSPGSIL